MAKTSAVWGIDIGQSALKAIRCRAGADGETVEADAFDFIEYPKILSQPDADATELVKEALEQFLSRNDVKGDRVAISVSGQAGLARFIKLPPVEAKKIPDIVKYEAKQQIPFALEEVVWDFQQMPGGNEEDGFALETEVGLFAMKRDQVSKFIQPFDDADIELDFVQLAPIAIFNFVNHEVLTDVPPADEFDPEDPPESLVVLSMGTDTTDLVITNGYRVWQRSIPLGGNHFTKQLTKDLKLTFAKAEHLKKNARQAEDPKTIFQAMRPIFNDFVTEVQRSLGFFQSIDRKAKLNRFVMLGNACKLPGLQQYLAKNLDMKLVELDEFPKLTGSDVVDAPAFKDNIKSFGTSYGAALQGLGQAKLTTNLVPPEIVTQRIIREKKPWALAAAALLLLACSVHYFFTYNTWRQVSMTREVNGVSWQDAMSRSGTLSSQSTTFKTTDAAQVAQIDHLRKIGNELVKNSDGRLLWLELLKAVNDSLPISDGLKPGEIPTAKDLPFSQRKELHIEYMESEYFPELQTWFTEEVKRRYLTSKPVDPNATEPVEPDPSADPANGEPVDPAVAEQPVEGEEEVVGPEGPGWVIELKGYHFFNEDPTTWGGAHLENTLLQQLEYGKVKLPSTITGQPQVSEFTMKELGIAYPVKTHDDPIGPMVIPNPEYAALLSLGFGGSGIGERSLTPGQPTQPVIPADIPEQFDVKVYHFTVQFCWQEKRLKQRMQTREQQEELERQQNAGNQLAGGN